MKALIALALVAASFAANATYTLTGFMTENYGSTVRIVNEGLSGPNTCDAARQRELANVQKLSQLNNAYYMVVLSCGDDGTTTVSPPTYGGYASGVAQ